MVEIPDSLQSLFSATVELRDGSYVIEIPKGEIDHNAISPSETYRVGVLEQDESVTETDSDRRTESRPEPTEPASKPPAPPVDEGEIRDVTIESVGDQGDGIAKVERGYVVIVPGAEPGDEPTVEIEEVQQNVAFASVIDSDTPAL
ncbi:TRAM domain-containing protein [Halostella sp. PRR32]|uniref:TRAM domain-containing protein n=1 Tax=Halostella sp. PRR32 TaxID=3098147 RepID=UPI002B1E77DD|nr:TRAM domain-containing protein [Halostella sp. PRR32]